MTKFTQSVTFGGSGGIALKTQMLDLQDGGLPCNKMVTKSYIVQDWRMHYQRYLDQETPTEDDIS